MAATHYRKTKTDPDNYDDINLGSDSELDLYNSQSEVVVGGRDGVIPYKDSSNGDSDLPSNGGHKLYPTSISSIAQDVYVSGDVTEKSVLEQEIDALLSSDMEEYSGGGPDMKLRKLDGGSDEDDGRYFNPQRVQFINLELCSLPN